jgi:hypothetical protein
MKPTAAGKEVDPALRVSMTGLTRSRAQTSLCLRQHGTSHFICCSFLARRAKKEQQKEDKVPL